MWAVGEISPWNGGDTLPSAHSAPLIEHWDGTAWSTDPLIGAPGSLAEVTSISPDDAWAVGVARRSQTYADPAVFGAPFKGDSVLIEHWDGTTWRSTPFAHAGVLMSVDAAGADDVWAVGGILVKKSYRGFVLHWDGTRWREAKRTPTLLEAVEVVGHRNVWAVGGGVLHWDGKTWKTVAIPTRTGTSTSGPLLAGVTAASPTNVWAVGQADQPDPTDFDVQPVILHWNGKRWLDRSPKRSELQGSAVMDVAAPPGAPPWLASVQPSDWYLGPLGGAQLDTQQGAGWSVTSLPTGQEVERLATDSSGAIWGVGSTAVGDSPDPDGYGTFDHTVPLIMRRGC